MTYAALDRMFSELLDNISMHPNDSAELWGAEMRAAALAHSTSLALIQSTLPAEMPWMGILRHVTTLNLAHCQLPSLTFLKVPTH